MPLKPNPATKTLPITIPDLFIPSIYYSLFLQTSPPHSPSVGLISPLGTPTHYQIHQTHLHRLCYPLFFLLTDIPNASLVQAQMLLLHRRLRWPGLPLQN
ncbi:hypothetical protein RJT34_25027 [Clitoria ternatea]|uniref:Uncharacterized protein n=1 Tax=Clitoria ternatea TaxID=43366 RepID=A0AAN9FPB5_CLITE